MYYPTVKREIKEEYSFRIYCNKCRNKIIDSDEITNECTQIIEHECVDNDFEIGISKFKNNKFIGE